MPAQPTSAARIAANRANAQKSTGPRTAEGKTAVANNAYKHGLRSERNPLDLASDVALPSERDEFLQALAGLTASLNPASPLETQLVDRLAQLTLRLHRALRMETTHLNIHAASERAELNAIGKLPDNANYNNSLTLLAFLRDPNALTLIGRYESRLSRDFARTLTQIHQLQKLRKQTQPAATGSSSLAGQPCLASDGQVARAATEIRAKQTHLAEHNSTPVDRTIGIEVASPELFAGDFGQTIPIEQTTTGFLEQPSSHPESASNLPIS